MTSRQTSSVAQGGPSEVHEVEDMRPAVRAFLRATGLATDTDQVVLEALNGGVSSEIWRVDIGDSSYCVKAALSRLKLAEEWHAPVSRSQAEFEWLQFAWSVRPGHAPQALVNDEDAGLFAMGFLPPEDYPVWKDQLLDGEVELAAAEGVGDLLGALHQASSHDAAVRERFDDQSTFEEVRITPYLVVPARVHSDLVAQFAELAARTRSIRTVLVHGDATPKNILIGPAGPVLLDAEWACLGDPAFDVAFCVNHLLLKAVHLPASADALKESAGTLVRAYLRHVDWEDASAVEARIAQLVPAFALALVDGGSPVGYLSIPDREVVRRIARGLMLDHATDMDSLTSRWG